MRFSLLQYMKTTVLTTLLLLSLCLITGTKAFAQQEKYLVDSVYDDMLSTMDKSLLDSILPLVKNATEDSIKLKHIWYITENTWGIRVWPKYNQLMYDIAKKNLALNPRDKIFLRYKGNAVNNFGFYHKEKENPSLALKNYLEALDIARVIHYEYLEATCYNNIGFIYQKMLGAPTKALSYYQKSLKIDEKNKDRKSYAITLANIGAIYLAQKDTSQAHSYYMQSLLIREEEKDVEGIARVSYDLASFYLGEGRLNSAQQYSKKSLNAYRLLGFERGVSENLIILGKVYDAKGFSDTALHYYEEAMIIDKTIENNSGVGNALLHIGTHYAKLKEYDKALRFLLEANAIFEETHFLENIAHSVQSLGIVYESMGNYQEGLLYYKRYKEIEAQLNNQEIEKRMVRQNLQSEFDKKEAEIESRMTIAKQKEHNKNIIITISIICLILVLGLLVYLYSRFKLIRDQKNLILKQQTLLEYKNHDLHIKNKQVADSINYAQYIAQTIFPLESTLETTFKDHFVFFAPKDIVSGDFYWAHPIDDNNIVMVVADCTGHGVPGAMLSLICASLLDQIVIQNSILQPNLILDQFYEQLIEKIARHTKDNKVNDGVEMSVCVYNKEANRVLLAASYHKIYLIENGNLREYNGDKIQIKKENFESGDEFSLFELNPSEGSTLYLFSDGFVDQKGGALNKKYFYAPFREFLLSIASLDMKEQKTKIEQEIKNWQGSNEQYDDMLIVGIRF